MPRQEMGARLLGRDGQVMTIAEKWKSPLRIAGVAAAVVVVGVGFLLAERSLRTSGSVAMGPLVLEDVPVWVDQSPLLHEKITTAVGGVTFPLEESVASGLAASLRDLVWLEDVQVRVTPEDVRIRALWRRPVALLVIGTERFYVDRDRVVLDYADLPYLSVKRVFGVLWPQAPLPGEVLDGDDLKEAIDLLALLEYMDIRSTPTKPLLAEIEGVDVGNFQGRRNSKGPHLVLVAKDGTQVIWGAEIGAWGRYLEARDEEKLAGLYSYYKECGTLMGLVKYIDLRALQSDVPSPIDLVPATGH